MLEEQMLFPPDLKYVIHKNLEKYSLPSHLNTILEMFYLGQRNERILICCHSDCDVCNQVILDCLQSIKKDMGKIE
jgi:hypothetical protein